MQQVAAARRRGAARRTGTRLDDSVEASIAFQRPLGTASRPIIHQLLNVLRQAGTAFAESEADRLSAPLSWQLVAGGPEGSASAIRLVFENSGQALSARGLLHDKAVRVGSEVLTMIFSDEVALVASAKNGRRQG